MEARTSGARGVADRFLGLDFDRAFERLYPTRPDVRRLAATPTACVRSTVRSHPLPRRWRWG